MPCIRDVEKAILDKVVGELDSNNYSFNRMMDDTIQIIDINSKGITAAGRRSDSKTMADKIASDVAKSFNGFVKGIVNDRSEYDPITVRFKVNPEYTNYEYSKLQDKTPDTDVNLSPVLNSEEERDNVNNNTGPNTRDNGQNDRIIAGITEKFIEYKKLQLETYNKEIDSIKGQKKLVTVTKERLDALNKKERELKLIVEGNKELGIVGLRDEIEEARSNAKPVSYYMEKDLDRLAELSHSNNTNDITEANRIIKFIENSGKFDDSGLNPFFDKDDIFAKNDEGEHTSRYLLNQETRDAFNKWAAQAVGFNNIVNEREQELLVRNINDSVLVKNTYGNNRQKYGQIMYEDTGLKDADWFSMYLLDASHGLFSHNGLIPQVIMSNLVEATERKERWSREMSKYLDDNDSKIKKELINLGQTIERLGITGLKAATFNMFKQMSKEGNETNNLVQRETKEYTDNKSKAMYTFSQGIKRAMEYSDYDQRQNTIVKAFENLKKWKRENSIMIDPSRLTTDENYKSQLITMLGQKGYDNIVQEQIKNTNNYESYRQGSLERLLIDENKDTYDELSDSAKNKLKKWELSHNPETGYKDYNSISGLFFDNKKKGHYNTFNTFVPRKYVADIKADIDTDKYTMTSTDVETGHWDKNFEQIQANPVLSEFYDKVKEFCEVIYENLPYDLQEKTGVYTLPGLMKTTAEMINGNNESAGILNRVSKAYRSIMDRFRTSFGVVKQGNIAYTSKDPVTGKDNYKVNDGFLRNNSRAIDSRRFIESTRFLQAYNANKEVPLDKIKRSTSLLLSGFNTSSLIQLAQYLHANITLNQIETGNIATIQSKLEKTLDGKDYVVDLGRLINDFSVHSVVQSQSFDLPQLMKYFSEMTMGYAARQEALPLNEILKKHYNKILAPDTNNVGETLWNKVTGNKGKQVAKIGIRTGANKQMDDWFDRVMLDNYSGSKHVGIYGWENRPDGKIPFVGKNIYSTEERKKYNELQELIKNETNDKTRAQLIATRDALGKTRTATAALNNFLNWIRTLRLGYNLSSMATNFLEGVTSNMILASSNEYFEPKEMFYGYRVIKWSIAKNITFGYLEHPMAKKNRSLVEKFNVIIDNRNELQNNYSSKILGAINAYAGNQRVEFINQSPIMIALLRTAKIKDKAGNESSVWDAYNPDGHLQDEFRTPENIENWEALTGHEYDVFKEKLEGLIVQGHGNYHKLRGMMAKSSTIGKAGMMFKTWLPEAVYWRLANKQDNIFLGKQGVKGIYRSHSAGTGIVHGAVVGAAMFGPVGAIIGGGIGGITAGVGGTASGVGLLKESIEATRLLVKKAIGIPINLIAGGQVINLHEKYFVKKKFDENGKEIKQSYFDYVGKGKNGKGSNFTLQDSKNLQASMGDIAMQLLWLGLILATKHFFWDDNDKPQDNERIAHNILMNRLMQLGSQASMYTNPVAFKSNTIESMAVIDYLKELSKEVDKVQKWFNGQDIVASGQGGGQSGLGIQTKKILLPGFFKDNELGFKSMGQTVYPVESPYHKYFHNAETIEKDENKRQRAERRYELEQTPDFKDMDKLDDDALKEKKKALKKILDEELPTPKMKEKGAAKKQR